MSHYASEIKINNQIRYNEWSIAPFKEQHNKLGQVASVYIRHVICITSKTEYVPIFVHIKHLYKMTWKALNLGFSDTNVVYTFPIRKAKLKDVAFVYYIDVCHPRIHMLFAWNFPTSNYILNQPRSYFCLSPID